jgi:hypothetical protein
MIHPDLPALLMSPSAPPPLPFLAQNQQSVRDREQLRLLAGFHFAGAALAAMFSLMVLLPWISGPAEIRPKPLHPDPIPDELLYTMILSGLASSAVANVLSAVSLLATKRRFLSLIVAWFNCLNLPLGTILGIFTLVVLHRPSVVATYEQARPQAHSPSSHTL